MSGKQAFTEALLKYQEIVTKASLSNEGVEKSLPGGLMSEERNMNP